MVAVMLEALTGGCSVGYKLGQVFPILRMDMMSLLILCWAGLNALSVSVHGNICMELQTNMVEMLARMLIRVLINVMSILKMR